MPNSTLYPLPKDIAQAIPPVDQRIAQQIAAHPAYQGLQQPGEEASFGAAGLLPALGAAGPAGMLAAPLIGSAAPLVAAAYGVGKLVAPKWTDQAIGTIRDFLKTKVAPVVKKVEAVGSAYETGMAQAIPGSRFIEKHLPQETQDFLTQIKNQHPLANKAGQAAGTIGMMALPGANIVKGAGLLGTAANAALNVAPYALGTGLDVGTTTGDIGKGIKAGLFTEGLGTALPTGISALSNIPAVSRFLAKVQLASADVRSQDVSKITRGYAKSLGMSGGQIDTYTAKHADDLVNQAADLVGQYGAGRAGKAAIKKWNSEGFQAHADLWDNLTGKKIGEDDIAAVLGDSDLAPLRARFGDEAVANAVTNIGKELNGQGWTASRRVLTDYSRAGNDFAHLSPRDPKILDSAVADIWHDRLDGVADRAMEWAKAGELGPEAQQAVSGVSNLHLLKATYPATLAMTKAEAREAAGISGRFAGGSDTAARQMLMAAPMIAGGGVMAPGAISDMLQNPENIPQDLLKIGLGSVGGRLLTRGAGRAAELGTGALAGALRKAGGMTGESLARLPAQTGELVDVLAKQGGGAGAMPIGGTLSPRLSPQAPEQQQPAEQVPLVNPPGMQQIPNAQAPVAPVPIPNALPQLSPQEQAQIAFQQAGHAQPGPPTFNGKEIQARLDEKYTRYVRQYGESISRQDYEAAARRTTQDFDPMLPNTWKAMFDDPTTSEKLYKGYLNLQKIADVDPASALNHYTRFFHAGPRLSGPAQKKEEEDNTRLVQVLADMTGQPAKTIDGRLKQIAWDKQKSPAERQQMVLNIITKEGGIDIPLLTRLGLW